MIVSQKRIAFKTIGCKLNFAETSTIVRQFQNNGFEVVEFGDSADVYVVNTCTVTKNADKDCRKSIRHAVRNNPDAFIAMIGCYSQLHSEEAKSIPGINAILGNDEKFKLFEYYINYTKQGKIEYHGQIDKLEKFNFSYSAEERTRTFLKIQDGCDYECTYCTIPLARGKSRSDSIQNTMQRAREVAKTNTQEIVLTGVNTGDFGKGTNESFFDLMKELDRIEGIDRIRISSIEPNLLTQEMIEFIARSKLFVPHFHIPLQSGSNKILKDMRRRYQRDLYAERIKKINLTIPNCCIGVDVIVGFPTETEKDFQDTFNFLKELDISYLHVFPYSERNNTKAINFDNVVSQYQKTERSKMLHKLSDEKLNMFYNRFVGESRNVLFESAKNGKVQGHTDNYIKVIVKGNVEMVNKIQNIKLMKIKNDFMIGEY